MDALLCYAWGVEDDEIIRCERRNSLWNNLKYKAWCVCVWFWSQSPKYIQHLSHYWYIIYANVYNTSSFNNSQQPSTSNLPISFCGTDFQFIFPQLRFGCTFLDRKVFVYFFAISGPPSKGICGTLIYINWVAIVVPSPSVCTKAIQVITLFTYIYMNRVVKNEISNNSHSLI